jgi:hypothetical protein
MRWHHRGLSSMQRLRPRASRARPCSRMRPPQRPCRRLTVSRAAAAAFRSARAVGAVATATRHLGSRSRANPPSLFAHAANYAHLPDVESEEAVSALYERWRRAFNKERDHAEHAEMTSGHSHHTFAGGMCSSCEDGGVGKLSYTHTRIHSVSTYRIWLFAYFFSLTMHTMCLIKSL